ncbi:hypothetical protein [Ktedonospora formicarum]|uniref:hypothetical protein n=1 Tax=Ktedonospora formicarum TaxID=2778364 RepID=UPI001C69131D|nr:hypothetical protein [Ktedonospora formicarum]
MPACARPVRGFTTSTYWPDSWRSRPRPAPARPPATGLADNTQSTPLRDGHARPPRERESLPSEPGMALFSLLEHDQQTRSTSLLHVLTPFQMAPF